VTGVLQVIQLTGIKQAEAEFKVHHYIKTIEKSVGTSLLVE
jgi:hypothetical protein